MLLPHYLSNNRNSHYDSLLLVSKTREIESIEINENNNLLMYLSNGGEPNLDGGGSPFSVVSERMLMTNFINIKIFIWEWNDYLQTLRTIGDNINVEDKKLINRITHTYFCHANKAFEKGINLYIFINYKFNC